MQKIKITMTITREYEPDPNWYPANFNAHQMLETDLEGVKSDYYLFLDSSDAKIKIEGEVIADGN